MKPYKIEKNIPMPGPRGNTGGLADTMKKMEVGDSFLAIPELRVSLYVAAKRLGIRVATRLQDTGKQMRVWRIK